MRYISGFSLFSKDKVVLLVTLTNAFCYFLSAYRSSWLPPFWISLARVMSCLWINDWFSILIATLAKQVAQYMLFLVFTQFQEAQKTIDIAAMLVSWTKEIIKNLLSRVHQHGCHEVRWKPAIRCSWLCNIAKSRRLVNFSSNLQRYVAS